MDLVAQHLPKEPRRTPGRPEKPALWRAYWKKPGDQRRNRLVEAYQSLVHDVVQRFAQRLPPTWA
jgi:DNA-directed RNA polymerase specialized sigma subunit